MFLEILLVVELITEIKLWALSVFILDWRFPSSHSSVSPFLLHCHCCAAQYSVNKELINLAPLIFFFNLSFVCFNWIISRSEQEGSDTWDFLASNNSYFLTCFNFSLPSCLQI